MSNKYRLSPFIRNRPWLIRLLTPLARRHAQAAGYRQMGLRADDLINEEDEIVLKALKRLPPSEQYDRVYRIRRAIQLSIQQRILPEKEWLKEEEDVPYLSPLVNQIIQEEKERHDLDSMTVIKSH